jgi:hypothetical protein
MSVEKWRLKKPASASEPLWCNEPIIDEAQRSDPSSLLDREDGSRETVLRFANISGATSNHGTKLVTP